MPQTPVKDNFVPGPRGAKRIMLARPLVEQGGKWEVNVNVNVNVNVVFWTNTVVLWANTGIRGQIQWYLGQIQC